MKYEIKRYASDPFDIMCSDCPLHEIEYWEEASIEKLHQLHEEFIEIDKHTPDFEKESYKDMLGEEWRDTPVDFEEFLKEEIASGHIREVA